jgi:hypothetical protein
MTSKPEKPSPSSELAKRFLDRLEHDIWPISHDDLERAKSLQRYVLPLSGVVVSVYIFKHRKEYGEFLTGVKEQLREYKVELISADNKTIGLGGLLHAVRGEGDNPAVTITPRVDQTNISSQDMTRLGEAATMLERESPQNSSEPQT